MDGKERIVNEVRLKTVTIQIVKIRQRKIHYWVIMEQICSAWMPSLRLQGGIYAVLWNKYPVMGRFIKPSEY
jgi:hypothetical protein